MASRMEERKEKRAQERPVLTVMKINRRSIRSVFSNPVRPMTRSVHKEIVMTTSTPVARPKHTKAIFISRGPKKMATLVWGGNAVAA